MQIPTQTRLGRGWKDGRDAKAPLYASGDAEKWVGIMNTWLRKVYLTSSIPSAAA